MKLIKVLLLTLCLLALVPQLALAQGSSTTGRLRRREGAIPNSYIVVFKDSVPQGRVKAFAAQLARTHGGTIGFTYQHALRGFSVELNEAQALALSRNPQVEYVEENTLIEGAGVQSNPTWALDRIDQRNLPLNASYNYANSGAGVNAYIIDSGIHLSHDEFESRAKTAYDNVGDGRNGVDCTGHGTHVAGIIGGKTHGVAKDVKLWSVRVLSCLNQGSPARNIAGIDWVIANHVKPAVANLSFATGVGSDALDLAVRNLIAAGVTTVVAAGNNTGDAGLRSPARVTEAITVAATDQFDKQSPNSNFGSVVDLYAPGVDILSAWHFDNASYNLRSGTSFAAPFVAGLAARYLASRPGDQPDAVSQAIMNAATPSKVINPGTGSPNLLAYAGNTISDDFNNNTRDATTWHAPTATDVTVAEQNGRLEIIPNANAINYDGYKSATTADLTDARISVQASIGQSVYGFGSYLVLGHSSADYLVIGIAHHYLLVEQVVGGAVTNYLISYDATQHRFWRFRHKPADDYIYWEASPDGVTWKVLYAQPRAFSITDLQVSLIAGKSEATTPTTTVTFDNLWHEANPTPPVVIADNFNDNVLNRAMWQSSDANAYTMIQEQNGQLKVTLPPNTDGYYSMGLTSPIDFRDKTMQVEVVQTASQAGSVQTHFQLYSDPNNYYLLQTSNNGLTCEVVVNGVLDRTAFTWDGSRFWRYRHDVDANTVNFETSADGAAWMTRKTVAARFPLGAVTPVIGAGASGTGNSAPGTAIFDNFRVERYPPLFPQSDNFNDNARNAKKWNIPATTDFTISEQNGQLAITPGSPAHEGYTSVNTFDLTDARASVEGISAPLFAGCASYFELIDPNTGDMLLIGVSGGAFVMEQHASGVVSRAMLTYNAAQHRFWRIRHNRANDTVNWETSADNISWTTHRTAPRSFPVTNLQIALIAGRGPAAASVTVIFDNLRIERNEGGKARTGGGGGNNGSGSSGDSGGSDSSGETYDAVTNFSHTQNPTGPWAYGYKPSSGALTLFESASTYFGGGTNTWALSGQECCPMVTKNNTGSTYTYANAPSVVHPADLLNVHPGPSGERSVVRWTAPTAGAHTISGRFQGLDTGGTTSDVLITHNGITIFSGNINGYGTELPYSLTRTVVAGDIVEFSVGYGENGNYGNDSTGLAATIAPASEAPPANAAPQVNAGLDATVNEGSTFSGTASFTDIDQTDTWTATVDYGDGTGAQPVTPTQSKTIPLSHVYKDNAATPYTVTVTVTDAAGASSSDTALVTSVNVPPTARLEDTPSTYPAGHRIKFVSFVGDPSQADREAGFMYLWTVTKNGGAYSQNAPGAGEQNDTRYYITPEEEGTYVVTLRVTDKDGGAVTVSRTIIVTKIEPSDDFNDNWMNVARWYLTGTPGVVVSEQNGQLQVQTYSSNPGYDGYYARTGIDMTNQGVMVEAVQPAFGDGLDTYFTLEDKTNSAQNRLLFMVGGAPGYLRMEVRYFNGTTYSISTQIPYDAVAHRFWRFRHDAAADTLKWETSPDGLTWTVCHSAARPFSLTNMQAQLYAGRSTTTPTPTFMKAIFDNYRVGEVTKPSSLLSDNFDNNLLDKALWTVLDPISPVAVREQNQRLEVVSTQPNGYTNNGVESAWSYNFWNKTLQVEIPQVGEAEPSYTLKLDENNYYNMRASGGILLCGDSLTGREHYGYSASAHRFWRFRHNAAANTMNSEVSPDGRTWTTVRSVQVGFSLNSMKVVLKGEGFGSGTPRATVFDNVKMEANQ